MGTSKKGLVKRSFSNGDLPSLEQYNAGYQMFRTGVHTVNRLAISTKMNKEQVVWCVTTGNEHMPSWTGVLDAEVSEMQAAGIEIAKEVGAEGARLLQKQMKLVKGAQTALEVLMSVYNQTVLAPGMMAMKDGKEDVDFSMPRGMNNAIKVLKSLTDTKGIAATFSTIYESHWYRPAAPGELVGKAGQLGLSPEAFVPAGISLVEDGPQKELSEDPVSTLLGIDVNDEDALRAFLGDDSANINDLLEGVIDIELVEDNDTNT